MVEVKVNRKKRVSHEAPGADRLIDGVPSPFVRNSAAGCVGDSARPQVQDVSRPGLKTCEDKTCEAYQHPSNRSPPATFKSTKVTRGDL